MRQTLNMGPSGNNTPYWKPVPKEKERSKKTTNSPQSAKGGRRRQKQNPVSSTRSWRASALWHRMPLSCKYKRTESNSYPRRGRGVQPRSGERLRRHAKRARSGKRRQGTPTFPPVPSQTLRTPAFPPAPTQARVTPTFLLAPNLAQDLFQPKTVLFSTRALI